MEVLKKISYDDFIVLNDRLSFHPGGLMATLNLLSRIPVLHKDDVILDFGCGNGTTLSFLKKLGFNNLVGYDRNINAATISQKNNTGISFYNDPRDLARSVAKVDIVLMESIFSFNGQQDLGLLVSILRRLVQSASVKHIGIIDIFSNNPIPDTLLRTMAETFGVRKIRSLKEFEDIFNSISSVVDRVYFHDYPFSLRAKEKYVAADLAKKAMNNFFISDVFETQEDAEAFFSEFITNMLSAYDHFGEHFNYFECIISCINKNSKL